MNFNFLKRPHPFIFTPMSYLIPGVVVFILMFVLSPFGLSNLPTHSQLLYALLFGLIGIAGVLLTITSLRLIVPAFMKEEKWTIGKEALLVILVIFAISILIYISFLLLGFISENSISLLTDVLFKTIGISILPITLLILYEQLTHQKKKLKQARELTQELRQRSVKKSQEKSTEAKGSIESPTTSSSAGILLEAENGNIELRVNPRQLVYLKSDGNYVEVFYTNSEGELKKKLIRNRLKSLLEQLPESVFFRCHKSYVVNSDHIISVNGNARNLELSLAQCDEPIPVSRSKSDELKQFLRSR